MIFSTPLSVDATHITCVSDHLKKGIVKRSEISETAPPKFYSDENPRLGYSASNKKAAGSAFVNLAKDQCSMM